MIKTTEIFWAVRDIGHTCFVIRVCENEEHVLEDRYEELVEKYVAGGRVSLGHIVHELKTHGKSRVFDLTIVVLASPHACIDNEFELGLVQFKQCREAMIVDRLQEFEEPDSVLRILVEILVDHFQRAFKNAFHDHWYFVLHKVLQRS